MQSNEGNDEKVFVIEMSKPDTHFSTRHDPAKYLQYFDKSKSRSNYVSKKRFEFVPGARGWP